MDGAEKTFRGTDKFYLIFGREDQKKGLHPGLLPCFVAQVSLGGQGEGARSQPTNSGGEDQKKNKVFDAKS